MIRSRLGLRAIGLCLALAGFMAVSVGVAQAEKESYWLVNKVKVTTLLPSLAATLENNHGQLLGSIGGTPIHILCKVINLVENHLLAEGGLLGQVEFAECIINTLKEGKVVPLPACTPPGGKILSTKGVGLLQLHALAGGPHTIVVLKPSVGTTFTEIKTGEECSFGEKIIIGGQLAVDDPAVLTDQVKHLILEFAPLTKLFINGNEKNTATIDGTAEVELSGLHKGLTWSGHPG